VHVSHSLTRCVEYLTDLLSSQFPPLEHINQRTTTTQLSEQQELCPPLTRLLRSQLTRLHELNDAGVAGQLAEEVDLLFDRLRSLPVSCELPFEGQPAPTPLLLHSEHKCIASLCQQGAYPIAVLPYLHR